MDLSTAVPVRRDVRLSGAISGSPVQVAGHGFFTTLPANRELMAIRETGEVDVVFRWTENDGTPLVVLALGPTQGTLVLLLTKSIKTSEDGGRTWTSLPIIEGSPLSEMAERLSLGEIVKDEDSVGASASIVVGSRHAPYVEPAKYVLSSFLKANDWKALRENDVVQCRRSIAATGTEVALISSRAAPSAEPIFSFRNAATAMTWRPVAEVFPELSGKVTACASFAIHERAGFIAYALRGGETIHLSPLL